MKKILWMFLAATAASTMAVNAQQDPQYTQYMYNQNVINPAYAGTEDAFKATALYRQQYSGLDGGPETLTFSGSTPLGERVGLGLNFINDEIGPVKEQNVSGDFSYRLPMNERITLALGIKAGVSFLDVNLNSTFPIVPGDPLLSGQVNETFLNIGAGAFLYSDNWYLGASVPNFLNSTHVDTDARKFGSEEQHYFVTGGYVFGVSENFKLKPHFLVKGAFESPVSFDVNLNGLFYDRFELGVSYRHEDSFSGLASVLVTDNIRVGYAYDRVTSDINFVAPSSHEFFVSFNFAFPRKVMQSPRFF
ncbi:MAG: type IX secretion system membrane protein PorP/SprF [Nonlabens sp.]